MDTKYQIEVTRTDDYEILIDESIWTDEYLSDWSNKNKPVDDCEDLAQIIAYQIMTIGLYKLYEGFGHIQTYFDYEIVEQENVTADQFVKGIVIHIIDQDSMSCTTTEIIDQIK